MVTVVIPLKSIALTLVARLLTVSVEISLSFFASD